ncbi:tctex1 domain-containing protein 1 [Puma concolor]|uniref:Tctex1 domain-containing protein 1 n=1 Tax=Puma concolor TaxID=9696 RepID=A0A6P6GXW0_PUMCO|nr:tctex1 domain-containing protein 1 [Puma concolor]
MMMSDIAKDRMAHSVKKRGNMSSLSGREFWQKELHRCTKNSMSTVSYMDEPSQRDDASRLTVQMENTYQLGPTKHFPVVIVNHILKDVLTKYLQEEQYEPELCRQMTKTISEVIKAQVKDLMIPRYKLIVIVHIGQVNSQNIFIGSRCLWDPKSDTFSSYVFRNSSLFALASVYAVYFE